MSESTYIVCTNIRSGSNLLCRSLSKIDGLGNPTEYFHPDLMERRCQSAADLKEYLSAIRKTTSSENGVFGLKIHWYQFQNIVNCMKKEELQPGKNVMDLLFPDAKLIFLLRQDTAAQAVSALTASQTGAWEIDRSKTVEASPNPPKLSLLNVARTYAWEKYLIAQTAAWVDFFQEHDLGFHEITYENLAMNFQSEMSAVVDYLRRGNAGKFNNFEMATRPANRTSQLKLLQYYCSQPESLKVALGRSLAAYRSARRWTRF